VSAQYSTLQESTLQEPVVASSICDFLSPPNPIITKTLHLDERAALRIDPLAALQEHLPSRHAVAHPPIEEQSAGLAE
jgi:hypothetical protein